jgi:hypothetical protein
MAETAMQMGSKMNLPWYWNHMVDLPVTDPRYYNLDVYRGVLELTYGQC